MTQMFGSRVHNYVFIDKENTGQVRDAGEVVPAGRWTSSSLLGGPPGPLVPGEVGPVGLDPRLGAPLLCDVVAPA